jgi:hypothetical protein
MRVHDVRPEIHAPAAFERRARQHQEASVFVGVGGVEPAAGIQRVRLDQEHGGGGTGQARTPDVDAVFVPPDDYRQAEQRFDPRHVQVLAGDLPVERHEQAHVVPARRELPGQRARDVGEPTGLGEWHDFGGNRTYR